MKFRMSFAQNALTIAFVLALTGCISNERGETANYGPEVPASAIEDALYKPLENADPLKVKVGEFVHFAETQEVAATSTAVVSDTGQTVISRVDEGDSIVLTLIEHKISYSGDTNTKVSREFTTVIEKPTPEPAAVATSTTPVSNSGSTSASTAGSTPASTQAAAQWGPSMSAVSTPVREPFAKLQSLIKAQGSPHRVFSQALKASSAPVTYHNLNVSVEEVPPPAKVQARANCGGLPKCLMTVHRISFNQVTWENGVPDLIKFDFVMSPTVPYLASVLNKCATLMVPVGEGNSKVLLKQCTPVQDFRFELDP